MSKFSFIREILVKNWNQPIADSGDYKRKFSDDIKHLSQNEWVCLLELYCECNDIKPPNDINVVAMNLSKGNSNDAILRIDHEHIIKFLRVLSLSEFRLDDILFHPPDMRFKEFAHIADSIGLGFSYCRITKSRDPVAHVHWAH